MTEFREICQTGVDRYAPKERQNYKADFSLNENPLGCSEEVMSEIKSLDKQAITNYQPIKRELLEKIADYEGVEPENLVISAGSDKCLQTLALAMFKKESTISYPVPSFPRYRFYVKLMSSNFDEIEYPLFGGRNIENILKEAKDSDFLIIDTPSNPAGYKLSDNELNTVSEEFEGKLILDMALEDNGAEIGPVIENGHFIVKSFSKFMGLAGLRLGYIITSKKNAEKLRSIVSPFEINSVAQIAGKKILEDSSHLEKSREFIQKERDRIKTELDDLGIEFTDSKSTNIVLRLSKSNQEKLSNAGINFTAGEKYRGLPDDVIRIGIRTEEENSLLLKHLDRILS